MAGLHDDDERIEAAITDAMLEIFERRESGEELSDADIAASYPSIADQLLERLRTPVKPENLPTLSADVNEGKPARPPIALPGYVNIRELRRGGQATVFSAVQQSTGQRVAIKIIHGGRLMDDRARHRFLREIKLLAALNHRNIVTIINQGETPDGAAYLIMRYVDGIALDDYVTGWRHDHPDAGPAPEALLRLFVKIAHAVDAAHRRGIVHRDLKPSNILVDRYGEPCVLDFGLARAAAMDVDASKSLELTRTGQFLGSLPWASPEQAHGDAGNVDARSDVYALGLLLYNMLTGAMPYKVTGSLHEVINNIVSAEPTPMTESVSMSDSTQRKFVRRYRRIRRWRAVHPCLEAVVLLALAKSADGRYATAGAMADDLETFLQGEKTIAWMKLRKRNRRMSVVVVGVLLLSGMVAVANLPSFLNQPPPAKSTAVVAPIGQALRADAGEFARRIPSDAIAFNGHSYLVVETLTTWDRAKKTAEMLGGHLAVVNDRPEMLFINASLMERPGGWAARRVWLGMESDMDAIFRTVTAEHVTYRQWDPRAVPLMDGELGGVTTGSVTWQLEPKRALNWFLVEWDRLGPRHQRARQKPGYAWAESFDGHRYLVVHDPVRHYEAKAICRAMGGELLCLESAAEEAFIRTLPEVATAGAGQAFWLGAAFYDNQFAWVNGRMTEYRNWNPQPNDPGTTVVVMTHDGWRAADPMETVEMRTSFICEWDYDEGGGGRGAAVDADGLPVMGGGR